MPHRTSRSCALSFHRLVAIAFALLALGVSASARSQAREEARVLVATQVLEEQQSQRDNVIPDKLLERAYGIAVVPNVTKVAFIIGGRRGQGLLVVRDKSGRFSSPVFISLTGGSVGWQIGANETDVILVFTTRRGIEGMADGKFTLGANASVAAGPVGRSGEVAAGVNAEVYAYSRSRGVFAGVALDGTAITIDNGANGRYYGKRGVLASDIMSGAVTKDSENVRRFLAAINKGTGDPTPATSSAPASSPATPAPGGVQTFPMEDNKPGAEPQ
ncbi:MAG: lipid-binding SYLF domain-containing protein [Steroidobacteraceae bacterium]